MKHKWVLSGLALFFVVSMILSSCPTSTTIGDDSHVISDHSVLSSISNEWAQGESVDYAFMFADQIPEILTVTSDQPAGYYQWANVLEQDGTTGRIYLYDGTKGYADFEIQVQATSWSRLYIHDATYSGASGILYFILSNGTRLSWTVSGAGLTSLELNNNATYEKLFWPSNVIRGHFTFNAVGGATTGLLIDQFIVEYNNLTGTVRSEYYIQNPQSTLHKVSLNCMGFGVDMQIDVPSHWEYQSCNPNATISAVSGRVIIENTVPTTYELLFTSDSSLRISNAEEAWTHLYESDGDEYNIVFQGSASKAITAATTITLDASGDYYVTWSHYIDSGTFELNDTTYTDLGAWESHCFAFTDLEHITFTATDAYLDNIRFYTANLTNADFAEGNAYHISPYGLYRYQYSNEHVTILEADHSINSNSSDVTDSLGFWSINTGLAATGTWTAHVWAEQTVDYEDSAFPETVGFTGSTFTQTVDPDANQAESATLGFGDDFDNDHTGWGLTYANATDNPDYVRVMDDEGSTAWFQVRYTATVVDINSVNNPFVEIKINAVSDCTWGLRFYYNALGSNVRPFRGSSTTGVFRYNLKEGTGGATDIHLIDIVCESSSEGSYVDIDYLIIYGFDNYDYSDSGDGTVYDVAYQDGTKLHWERNGATAGWVALYDASPDENIWAEPWIRVLAYSAIANQAYMNSLYNGPLTVTSYAPAVEANSYKSCGGSTTLTDIQFVILNSIEATFDVPEWYEIDNWAEDSWNSDGQYAYQSGDGFVLYTDTSNIGIYRNTNYYFTEDLFILVRYRSSAGASVKLGHRDDALQYNSFNIPTSTAWTTVLFRLMDEADYTIGEYLEKIFFYVTGTNEWLEIDYVRVITRPSDTVTFTVQQLGYASATLTRLSNDQYVLAVTGATYSDQLYNISLNDAWIGTSVSDNAILSVNTTIGQHSFNIYAIGRDQGYYSSDVYYIYLEADSSQVYSIDGTLSLSVWGMAITDSIYASFTTNWGNTTVYCYDNNTGNGNSPEGYNLQFTKSNVEGLHIIGFKIDGGGESLWWNTSYSIAVTDDLAITLWTSYIEEEIYISCTTNWANTTIYMYDNNSIISNSAEGTNLIFAKSLTDGLHVLGFYVDGGADGIWVNSSYTIAVAEGFTTVFVETRINDETIRISIITTWANSTIYCYDNDTIISNAAEGMNLDFVKSNLMGLHQISFLADGGADTFWVNTSYTITYIEVFISVYSDVDGFGFTDWSNVFKVYINGTRIYETSYYASTNAINITILSYFNESLYSADHLLATSTDRSIELPISLYEQLFGSGGVNAIRYDITRNGFTRTITVSGGKLQILRLPNSTYTVVATGLWTGTDGDILQEIEKYRDTIVLPTSDGILSFVDRAFADTARINQVGVNQDFLTGVVLMSMLLSTISTIIILFVKTVRKPKTEFIPVPFEEQPLKTRTRKIARPLRPRTTRKKLRI